MTIAEYRESLGRMQSHKTKDGRTLSDMLFESMDIWNNDACRGYGIAAMQEAGIDAETIGRVLACYRGVFDFMTVKEAEQKYFHYHE